MGRTDARTPRERGTELADALAGSSTMDVEEALESLRAAPSSVTAVTAKEMARRIKKGDRSAESICLVLARPDGSRFGGADWNRLFGALTRLQSGGGRLSHLAARASAAMMARGPDPAHLEKLEEERSERARRNPLLRVLSVAKRAWVLVCFPVAAFAVVMGYSMDVYGVVTCVLLLVGAALAFVVIDAFRRRCPSCRTLLAGLLLSIVQDGSYTQTHSVDTGGGTRWYREEVATHRLTWRCVRYGHRWST